MMNLRQFIQLHDLIHERFMSCVQFLLKHIGGDSFK